MTQSFTEEKINSPWVTSGLPRVTNGEFYQSLFLLGEWWHFYIECEISILQTWGIYIAWFHFPQAIVDTDSIHHMWGIDKSIISIPLFLRREKLRKNRYLKINLELKFKTREVNESMLMSEAKSSNRCILMADQNTMLNKRDELLETCRHWRKHLLEFETKKKKPSDTTIK